MEFDISNVVLPVWLPLLWGLLVGLVFSTVGAAGGLLASIGLISVMGISNANLIKPMGQILTMLTPLIAVPAYYKQRRLVGSLGLLLGAGGVLGAIAGSTLSVTYLNNIKIYKPVFGIFVLIIAAQLAWVLIQRKRSHNVEADRAASVFEFLIDQGGNSSASGVHTLNWSWSKVRFEFGHEIFEFNPWLPFLVGMVVAIVSSALGVGGGFLIVPFMTQILGLPMFIVAGTATLAIFVSSGASISNYLLLGVQLDIPLLILLAIGTIAGSLLGPKLSKYVPEKGLRVVLSTILLIIGLRYVGVW